MALILATVVKRKVEKMSTSTIKNLENFLNYTSLKGKVISRNIANINTEYYKRETVTFNDLLNEGMNTPIKQTNERHLGQKADEDLKDMNVRIVTDETNTYNSGINNVNIDQEMSDMAENTILFKFAARKINSYYKSLQDVIKGAK